MLSGWMDGVEWSGYPLDCYDYQSTCGANKDRNSNTMTNTWRETETKTRDGDREKRMTVKFL